MYAIAQKEGNGLDKAVEEAKYRMSRYGVSPTMMVIPPCATRDSNLPIPAPPGWRALLS